MKRVFDIEINVRGQADFTSEFDGAEFNHNENNSTSIVVHGVDWETYCYMMSVIQLAGLKVI